MDKEVPDLGGLALRGGACNASQPSNGEVADVVGNEALVLRPWPLVRVETRDHVWAAAVVEALGHDAAGSESDRLLSDAGKKLAVLTNKPVKISRTIVNGLGVGGRFFQVYGGNSFEFKKPNPIGVEALINEAGTARDRTMMVGDSSVDISTARNAGVMSCGVTYGFQPETLAEPAPDLLVDRMEQLADWVLSGRNGESK